jgi:osmotically-inducible protein OsmY
LRFTHSGSGNHHVEAAGERQVDIGEAISMKVGTLVIGGAIGAALAYLFDPDSGRGRRARLRDQTMSEVRKARGRGEAKQRYLSNVARGRMSELVSPGPDNRDADDATLGDRIRSQVFGSPQVPDDRIALTVVDGIAELRGELDAPDDILRLGERVGAVSGVRSVRNLLRVHGDAPPNKEDAMRASETAKRRAS